MSLKKTALSTAFLYLCMGCATIIIPLIFGAIFSVPHDEGAILWVMFKIAVGLASALLIGSLVHSFLTAKAVSQLGSEGTFFYKKNTACFFAFFFLRTGSAIVGIVLGLAILVAYAYCASENKADWRWNP